MARRNYRSRIKRVRPDMAWVVGALANTTQSDASGALFGFSELVDFAEIDSDDSRLAQDKSDWIITRILLDLYASCELDGLGLGDTARFYQLAVVTTSALEVNDMVLDDTSMHSELFYDKCARVLQTGMFPAYHAMATPLGTTTSLTPDSGVLTASSNSTGIEPTGWFPSAPAFGTAAVHWDISTKAGLKSGQSLWLLRGDAPGLGTYDWAEGDALMLCGSYRILMQKRRT